MVVDIIIPALDEERAIGEVVSALVDPRVRRVVVVDNGSRDATAARAREAGAVVVQEPRRGYGQACLTGLATLSADPPDVVGFIDGDGSDFPDDMTTLLDALARGFDMVIGSRTSGLASRGALLPQAIFGNWLATRLVAALFDHEYTDLGPMRVVTWAALEKMAMQDRDFGWTVEMQVRAARLRMRCAEVPVHYRRRLGDQSKVTGTVRGSVRAGHKILWTIAREALRG
ncbi:MAG: glycosyltransferase [Myxococcales bacterium]|nr:glycosyltransferase [Myxococcales bacterium]MCB9532682.1 glycosyltransferase [Myxococcales bacterium]MCB9533040.1 glycosyltransferase [Myxococcales bacterium]